MAEKMDAKLDYANQKVEQVIDTNRKLRVLSLIHILTLPTN